MKREEFERYLEESRGLERDYVAELVRSRQRAFGVAGVAALVATVALFAVARLAPLKRVEAFVLRVDSATGSVDEVTRLRDAKESYGEVVNKYFLNRYVLSRESYDYETIQSDFDTTLLLSSEDVQREYRAIYDGPSARDKVLSNRTRIVVKVRSITPARDTAVVRFTRRRETGGTAVEDSLVATIGFRYVGAAMKEEDRRVNPLGFQVTSYRVDPEVVGG